MKLNKGVLILIFVLIPLWFGINFVKRKKRMEENFDKDDVVKINFEGPEGYIKILAPSAKEIERVTGIPYLFIIAQTALETGYGKSSLVRKGANFAGIKAREGQPYILAFTTEYVSDRSKFPLRDKSKDVQQPSGKWKIYTPEKFAKYPSLKEGLLAYVKVLQLPRYKKAFDYKNDPYKFAEEIWRGGYATDPNYVTKMKVMIDKVKKVLQVK